MREAEAQLQALIQLTGTYSLGGGGGRATTTTTTPHHHPHFLGSPFPSSASSSSSVFLPNPPTPSLEVGPNHGRSGSSTRVEVVGGGGEENALFSATLIPKVVTGGGGGGGEGVPNTDPALDEVEKARMRQWKAALRKERNKAAARRSNLNKKIFRDQLEKKSVELWEQNLQLHQEIRELSKRLRHFRHIRSAMRHVCLPPPPPRPPLPSFPMTLCPC